MVSPGTPASSITKTGRHDVAEILLKVALNTIKYQRVKQSWTILWPTENRRKDKQWSTKQQRFVLYI
jgi:hypothetical protein